MRYTLILMAALLFPVYAYAQTALNFVAPGNDPRQHEIIAFLKNFQEAPPPDAAVTVAEADLNGDGVNEWIVRQTGGNCEVTADCLFVVAGLQVRTPVLLGHMRASRVEILAQQRFGVNTLAVFNNPADDFTPVEYPWQPQIRTFSPYDDRLLRHEG